MNEPNFKSVSILEIENVIRRYLDLLYKGDKDLIKTVSIWVKSYLVGNIFNFFRYSSRGTKGVFIRSQFHDLFNS